MLLVMCVALYTSRVVLDALGVEDYGIYNVVGGVSASFMFFSSSLTNSTQRFLNFELGKGNLTKVNNIFSVCLWLFCILGIIIIGLAITFGRWFVESVLNIPPRTHDAAIIVLYSTALTLVISLICATYESVLIARENMKIYAYLGIIDAIAKLLVAYLIIIAPNKLIYYAWLMLVATLIPKLIIAIYCIRHYPESRPILIWDRPMVKELFVFNGWNIYGSGIWILNEQGINIILNLFFGPIVNAARGVANLVNNAVTNFTSNFFVAVRPQIVKRYATNEYESLITLLYLSSKYSFFLLWIICLPLILNMEVIINIWLKNPPSYAVPFTIWALIHSLIAVLHNPIWSAVAAIGHLKRFILFGSNTLLLCFPTIYFVLGNHASPIIIYPILIFFHCIFQSITLYLISKYIPLKINEYVRQVIWPIAKIIIASLSITYLFNLLMPKNVPGFLASILIDVIVSATIIVFIGISRNHKDIIFTKMKEAFHI